MSPASDAQMLARPCPGPLGEDPLCDPTPGPLKMRGSLLLALSPSGCLGVTVRRTPGEVFSSVINHPACQGLRVAPAIWDFTFLNQDRPQHTKTVFLGLRGFPDAGL